VACNFNCRIANETPEVEPANRK